MVGARAWAPQSCRSCGDDGHGDGDGAVTVSDSSSHLDDGGRLLESATVSRDDRNDLQLACYSLLDGVLGMKWGGFALSDDDHL